jgi:hypothetical protein
MHRRGFWLRATGGSGGGEVKQRHWAEELINWCLVMFRALWCMTLVCNVAELPQLLLTEVI